VTLPIRKTVKRRGGMLLQDPTDTRTRRTPRRVHKQDSRSKLLLYHVLVWWPCVPRQQLVPLHTEVRQIETPRDPYQ
jgi:hypothetical protein